jgi:hypothetical protein
VVRPRTCRLGIWARYRYLCNSICLLGYHVHTLYSLRRYQDSQIRLLFWYFSALPRFRPWTLNLLHNFQTANHKLLSPASHFFYITTNRHHIVDAQRSPAAQPQRAGATARPLEMGPPRETQRLLPPRHRPQIQAETAQDSEGESSARKCR